MISSSPTAPGPAAAAAASRREEPERRRGFFKKLRKNLSKTREALGAEIQATLLEGDVDEQTWERLEEALIMADVGAATTARVVGELEAQAVRRRDQRRRGAQPAPGGDARRDRAHRRGPHRRARRRRP